MFVYMFINNVNVDTLLLKEVIFFARRGKKQLLLVQSICCCSAQLPTKGKCLWRNTERDYKNKHRQRKYREKEIETHEQNRRTTFEWSDHFIIPNYPRGHTFEKIWSHCPLPKKDFPREKPIKLLQLARGDSGGATRGDTTTRGDSGVITLHFTSTPPPPLFLLTSIPCLIVIWRRRRRQEFQNIRCGKLFSVSSIHTPSFRMGNFMGICCSLNLCSDFPRVTQICSLSWKEIDS